MSLPRTTEGHMCIRGVKCTDLSATLWSNLSGETTHLSRGSYSTGQSYGRKPVVRGLPR